MKHSKKIIETTLSSDNAGSEKTSDAVSKKRIKHNSRSEKERDVKLEDRPHDDGAYPWWVEYFGIDKSLFDCEEEDLEEEEDPADGSR